MGLAGRYINMDASPARRAAMEAQLERLGLADRYQRFAGVDGRGLDRSRTRLGPGELGCFVSHTECIKAGDPEGRHLHVMEDDVVLAPQAAHLLERAAADAVPHCDILFTDVFVPLETYTVLELLKQFRASGMPGQRTLPPEQRMPAYLMYPSLQRIPFGGATSYIVNAASREKVAALLEAELAAGPTQPVDMALRILVNQGRLDARVTVPFLNTIAADSIHGTTIVGRSQPDDSALAFYVFRSFFYLARDDAALGAMMGEINARLDDFDHLGPALEFYRFALSGRFTPF
jgi:hypothetical protein